VQGNCAHCHGPQTKLIGSKLRLDFNFDSTNSDCVKLAGAVGATAVTKDYLLYARPMDRTMPRMPPPPADPLPDWQIATIENWDDSKWKARDNDANPEATALSIPKTVSFDDAQFFVDVSDPDGDQVIGQVTIDGTDLNPTNVLGVGRTTVKLSKDDVAKLSTGKHDVKVALCDGQSAPTPFKVGTIEKR
jgi:hypothetical protein